MGTYAGDPNNYPAEITLPDDASPPTAANVNPALEGLADRIECVRTHGLLRLMKQEFISDGTWTAPTTLVGDPWAEGCGGGGGGGGGLGYQPADRHVAGGGGGGGALKDRQEFPAEPGTTFNVTIGAGGAGGAGGTSGDAGAGDGGDGSDTTIDDGMDTRVRFMGAQGGRKGKGSANGATGNTWGLGGAPARKVAAPPAAIDVTNMPDLYRDATPQRGGDGVCGNMSSYVRAGNSSATSFGGPAGTPSTTSSGSYRGGGCGGGGGAGPYFDNGGGGGNGGTANNAGASAGTTGGGSAANNSGAGGGGGGSAGGATTGGTGGAGGDGGSGRVTIYWWEKDVVLP